MFSKPMAILAVASLQISEVAAALADELKKVNDADKTAEAKARTSRILKSTVYTNLSTDAQKEQLLKVYQEIQEAYIKPSFVSFVS